MTYPQEYIQYLVYFHGSRDYFECHEVLEELWKKDKKEDRKKHWPGLIQVAVSLYHQRRGNLRGAQKVMQNAIQILEAEETALQSLDLHYESLIDLLTKRHSEIVKGKSYTSLELPIMSNELLEICKLECEKLNSTWGEHSDLSNEYIVHKHLLRDRSDVLTTREHAIKKREDRYS